MVGLVERMLELSKQKHDVGAGLKPAPGQVADLPLQRESPIVGAALRPAPGQVADLPLQHEIARTDAAIDELVYELYGITDEERKIIES